MSFTMTTMATTMSFTMTTTMTSAMSFTMATMAFTSPGAFRTLYDWRKSCYGAPGQLRTALEDAAFELEQHVAFTTDLSVRVEHRAKGLLSTFSKAGRGKKPRDILAVRLLIPGHDEKSCYAAMRPSTVSGAPP